MVEVMPFRGLRYNKQKVSDLGRVTAPPYDVISREYRNELRERSPHNCIHVTLGEEIGENKGQNLYARAREYLDKWISKGVLEREEEPAIYAYEQTYALKDGSEYSRKGFIPLVKLEPFENGNILPHEFTMSGPKQDRLELLRATEANTEAIFALFQDSSGRVNTLLEEVAKRKPVLEVKDDSGITNRLWAINEPKEIEPIVSTMKGKKLFVADGHHRYETHLKYSKENPKADSMMILLVEINNPGLTVLPTHRLMHGIEGFEFASFRNSLEEWFGLEEIQGDNKTLEKKLAEKKERAFLARSNGKTVLFSLKDSVDLAELIPGKVREIRGLDVTILHELVIEKILGISSEQIARKQHIEYVKDFNEAIEKADSDKFDVAFLMNATKKEQVIASCLAGQRMPQKSTYFYPKVLSGMLFRKIE